MNHERPKIVYIELMKCLRSIEGILNFTISKLSADFAALSASLFPCRPIWSSGPHEPTLYWIQWNGLLRSKGVVILDTGQHLTSHPTDISSGEVDNLFFIFQNQRPFWKGVVLHLNNLNPPHPGVLCAIFGWNWPSGSREEDENVKSLQTTDDMWSEKLTLAFSSGEMRTIL